MNRPLLTMIGGVVLVDGAVMAAGADVGATIIVNLFIAGLTMFVKGFVEADV